MHKQQQGLWKNSNFVYLWLGHTISNIGNGITNLALPLTAILFLSATPLQVAMLSAIDGTSVLLFGLLAGVCADRLPRRTILLFTDISRALLLGSIPIAALFGVLHLAQVYAVSALVALLSVFFSAADASLLPELASPQQLIEGNSKLAISDSLAEIIGPSLAGVLVQIVSAPLTIFLDSLSFLTSAFCTARIHLPSKNSFLPSSSPAHHNIWQDNLEGLLFIAKHPLLRILAGTAALFNFTGVFIGTLYTLYVVRTLHIPTMILGLLIATGGLSALVGASIAERVIRHTGIGITIGLMLFLYGITGLLIPLASSPIFFAVTFLFTSQLVGDIAVSIYQIAEISLRQSLTPTTHLGRVNASIQFLTRGSLPFGSLLAGVLSEYISIRVTLLIGVLGVMLAGTILLLSPVRKVQAIDKVHTGS
jgi:predicted MFS family arabinose efflux permease